MARKSQYHIKRIQVITAIADLTMEQHKTPTVREIADRTGIAIGTLHSYLERLGQEGMIEWRPKRHRSIKLTPEGQRLATTNLPF